MPAPLPSLSSIEPRSREWLLTNQDPGGGWSEHPGGRLSALNTAEVVLALTGSGIQAGNAHIRKAVAFLYAERPEVVAPDSGCWTRSVAVGPGRARDIPDLARTCFVIRALVSGGEDPHTSGVRSGIEWLARRQNGDHGWGYQRGEASAILPTCFALIALIRTADSTANNAWRDAIGWGLEYLTTACRNKSGSSGSGHLEAAHTVHLVLVLQAARESGFSVHPTAENDALAWLLRWPDKAMSTVEEVIAIDPQGQGNYGFLFAMDALLVLALGRSLVPDHRKTRLWSDVQRSLYGRWDEGSGGLFGQRVTSWSTAAGLTAIALTARELTHIPALPSEDPSGLKVGGFILFFAVVLVGALLYLSVEGFTILQASFLGFLMLAC